MGLFWGKFPKFKKILAAFDSVAIKTGAHKVALRLDAISCRSPASGRQPDTVGELLPRSHTVGCWPRLLSVCMTTASRWWPCIGWQFAGGTNVLLTLSNVTGNRYSRHSHFQEWHTPWVELVQLCHSPGVTFASSHVLSVMYVTYLSSVRLASWWWLGLINFAANMSRLEKNVRRRKNPAGRILGWKLRTHFW